MNLFEIDKEIMNCIDEESGELLNERQIANKKQYLGRFLGGQKFETARVKMTFRKSESLEVADDAIIPAEFYKQKDPELNKADLKKAVKAGLEIDGVSIVEKQNLQIK